MRYTLGTFPLRVDTGHFADTFGQLADSRSQPSFRVLSLKISIPD